MKNIKVLLIILSAALFFTACEKDETPELWTISGEVLVQDAQVSAITSPLADIEMYLLNFPFTVDSITDWVAQSDILKTTQTNDNGFYTFSDLQAGDYIVMPVDSTKGYKFSWSESPDSIWTSSTKSKSAYTMNFLTPEVHAENSSKEFKFTFNNDWENADIGQRTSIIIRRKRKTFPFWTDAKWVGVKEIRTLYTEDVCNCTVKQSDDFFHQYIDEYKIELYKFNSEAGMYHIDYFDLLKWVEIKNPGTNIIIDIGWTANKETVTAKVTTNNE